MALVNRSFSVNVTPGMMPPIVHVSEYDVGRAYTVSILDEQGNTFTIPSGTTASIEGTLNGSVGFTQSATVSNNQVLFTLSQSMTAYSGKAWCKIKLTQNSQPIQTCAFILAVDRAGVEADTVIGAPGFQEQINEGIAEYFDNDPPFFELPSGGQSGQALLSDGADGAFWGEAQGDGSGLSDDAKTALLSCFRNVAWIGSDGQDYYDDLYDALYPPAPPASLTRITALFNQGSHVVYNTDSLDSLKPYLTVTAYYSNGASQPVTAYTLSGTLTVGTSVVTVSYGGKTTTFNVSVTEQQLAHYIYDGPVVAGSAGYLGWNERNNVIGVPSPSNLTLVPSVSLAGGTQTDAAQPGITTIGRSTSRTQVINGVSDGQMVGLSSYTLSSGASVAFALWYGYIDETDNSFNGSQYISRASNFVGNAWLSNTVTLPTDASKTGERFLMIAFKRGDGSEEFTAAELAELPTLIQIT